MMSNLLFTLFSGIPGGIGAAGGNSGDDNSKSNALVSPGVQKMLSNDSQTFTFMPDRVTKSGDNIFLQFVFVYRFKNRPDRTYYHSFTLAQIGYSQSDSDRDLNENYITISDFEKANSKATLELNLSAPYPLYTKNEDFNDYKAELNRHIKFASDVTVAELAHLTSKKKFDTYCVINVYDNYNFIQELLSRVNGTLYYGDKDLEQVDMFVYRHKVPMESFNGSNLDYLKKYVQKYKISSIEADLSDWRVGLYSPTIRKDKLLVGPRSVKLKLNCNKQSTEFTDDPANIRNLLFLWKDDWKGMQGTLELPKIPDISKKPAAAQQGQSRTANILSSYMSQSGNNNNT